MPDYNPSTKQYGIARLVGFGAASIEYPDGDPLTGWAAPNFQGAQITHNAEVVKDKDANGEIVGVSLFGESLEASIDFMPVGATVVEAAKSASIPQLGAKILLHSFPIMRAGWSADAWNDEWQYRGGGSVTLNPDSSATLTLPIEREPEITDYTDLAE